MMVRGSRRANNKHNPLRAGAATAARARNRATVKAALQRAGAVSEVYIALRQAEMARASQSAAEMAKLARGRANEAKIRAEKGEPVEAAPIKRDPRFDSRTPILTSEEAVDQLFDRMERRYASAARLAEAALRRDQRAALLKDKWGHTQFSPETAERIDQVPARKRQSAMMRMHLLGKLSADELAAGQEIAAVVEGIERAVSVSCASLEARVDNSGSARDALVESLGRVRLEVSYRIWRGRLPQPRSMILDMIVRDQTYVAIAAKHRIPYRSARKMLISALRLWQEIRVATRKEIDREDVIAAHARLGEGVLTAPRPKHQPIETEETTDVA